jgi:uncharacterized protein YndB with AHSA1/START domain
MPVAADAILQDREGRAVLRFERTLRHPPERVWSALTEPDELSTWHPTPFELDPQAHAVNYLPGGDVPDMPDGELTRYDPPRLLAYGWGEDWLQWELRRVDDGCVLVLTHTFDDRLKAARDAAGWHLCLQALSSWLERGGAGRDGPDGRSTYRELLEVEGELPRGWADLNRAYQQRFGISPEEATPPPEL